MNNLSLTEAIQGPILGDLLNQTVLTMSGQAQARIYDIIRHALFLFYWVIYLSN